VRKIVKVWLRTFLNPTRDGIGIGDVAAAGKPNLPQFTAIVKNPQDQGPSGTGS
jgi:hypothetical protein